jgi:hypothetical protein
MQGVNPLPFRERMLGGLGGGTLVCTTQSELTTQQYNPFITAFTTAQTDWWLKLNVQHVVLTPLFPLHLNTMQGINQSGGRGGSSFVLVD